MFYRKNLPALPSKTSRIKIPVFFGPDSKTNESVLPMNTATTAYNFRLTDGALSTGIGLRRAKMPRKSDGVEFELPQLTKDAARIFIYRRYDANADAPDDRIIAVDRDGYFYAAKLTQETAFSRLTMPKTYEPCDAVNYRYNGVDVILISVALGLYIYDGTGQPYLVQHAPKIKSMCVHSERIYASVRGDNTSVWFSDTFDPTNWNVSLDDGGFIDFADEGGYVRKVVQFNDSVYIFRDYSVERLIAYGEQQEFSVSKICTLGSKIIPQTIIQGGDYIIFMLRDGLYIFDGFGAKKVFERVTGIIDTSSDLKACFDKNKYYLAARAGFGDGKTLLSENAEPNAKNALFEFDIKNATVNILRGANILDVASVKTVSAEKIVCGLSSAADAALRGTVFELDYSGKIGTTPLPMLWSSAYNALGSPDRKKLIRKAAFMSKYDCVLRVNADGREFEYAVKGGDKPVSIAVMKPCSQFSAAFLAEGDAEIRDAVILAEEYGQI
ncbi:MAG: hypothetical protein LBQ40_01125 [Clostridiales bacterium]|jgi:hypothetical protein|nr:hypothetical protein [Clostridiales bacterium]